MSSKKIVDTFNEIDKEMVYVKNKLDSLTSSVVGAHDADSSANDLQKMQEENKALQREMLEIMKQIAVYDLLEGKSPLVLKVFLQNQQAKQASSAAPVQHETVQPPAAQNANASQQQESEKSKPASKKQKGKKEGKEPAKSELTSAEPTNQATEKKPASAAAGDIKTKSSSAPAPIGEAVSVSLLDFRVGKIVEIEKHPDADSLYVEKIDLGEEKPRNIVSGLVKHVPIEEMKDRMVIVLCNLKPAKMRGVTSEGMVMCASTPEKVEVLIPPAGSVPGDRVSFEGHPGNPDKELNPKKKIWETLAPELSVDANKTAVYKGNVAFTVAGKGAVKSPSLTGCPVK